MEIVARGRLAGEEELPDSDEAKQRKAIGDSSGCFGIYFLVQVKHGQTCESQCTHTRQVEVHRKTHTRTVADGMDNV